MENWLYNNRHARFNLAESGAPELSLKELFELCNLDFNELGNVRLGNQDKWGSIEFREGISETYKSVSLEDVLVTTSTSEALFCIFATLLKPQDRVTVVTPTFAALYDVPLSLGCKVNFFNVIDKNAIPIDIGRLIDSLTQDTKMVVINNPNNPMGYIINENDLRQIIEIAEKRNIYVVLDEHYRFLNHASAVEPVVSGFDLDIDYKKLLSTGSITKCFGMNGLRIGWVICKDRTLLDRFLQLKECLTYAPPVISDYIALVTLKNRKSLLNHHLGNIHANLSELGKFIRLYSELFSLVEPSGGAVCFPRLLNDSSVEFFCQSLIDYKDISFLPGSVFGNPRHFRMNISYNTHYFGEALKELQGFINNGPPKERKG